MVIVILNALMGVVQESKAEAALNALKQMTTPQARVIRNGKEEIVPSQDLVPGDIIKLEAGDFVPADARLFQSVSLKSEEAALTGESVPAEKDAGAIVKDGAPLGDRVDMVYSGCSITYGTGQAIVCAIGMDTDAIDLKYARQVADYIGSDHTEIIITREDVLSSLEAVVELLGTYDITTIRASMGMYLICKAIHARTDLRVLLTGEISDELFGYKYTDFALMPPPSRPRLQSVSGSFICTTSSGLTAAFL